MNYNNTVKLNIIRDNPSVVVLTPTTGAPVLEDAIQSVLSQDYKGTLHHHLVVDGKEYNRDFYIRQKKFEDHPLKDNIKFTWLNDNVGKNGFYGHRIYAAFPHLLNYDYIFFLDQDASYEPNHVSSMIKVMMDNHWDWAYSLRKIYNTDGTFLCDDNCESLGEWPVFFDENTHLVDTSCFAFQRKFLIEVCGHWHWGWGGDRRFFNIMTKHYNLKNFGTNMLHTARYRLGGNENSPKPDMFIQGNAKIEEKYGTEFPWHSKTKP
jgi:hypothetical protein